MEHTHSIQYTGGKEINEPNNKFIFEKFISPVLKEVEKEYRLKYFHYNDPHYNKIFTEYDQVIMPLKIEKTENEIKRVDLEAIVLEAVRTAKKEVFFKNKRYQRQKGIDISKSGLWLISSGGTPYLEIEIEPGALHDCCLKMTDHCGGSVIHTIDSGSKPKKQWDSHLEFKVDNRRINDACRHRRETLVKIYDKIYDWYEVQVKTGDIIKRPKH